MDPITVRESIELFLAGLSANERAHFLRNLVQWIMFEINRMESEGGK
jgi:hypothetical protein